GVATTLWSSDPGGLELDQVTCQRGWVKRCPKCTRQNDLFTRIAWIPRMGALNAGTIRGTLVAVSLRDEPFSSLVGQADVNGRRDARSGRGRCAATAGCKCRATARTRRNRGPRRLRRRLQKRLLEPRSQRPDEHRNPVRGWSRGATRSRARRAWTTRAR